MEKAVVLTIQTSSSRLQVGVVCPLYFHDTEHFIKVASRRGRACLAACYGVWVNTCPMTLLFRI